MATAGADHADRRSISLKGQLFLARKCSEFLTDAFSLEFRVLERLRASLDNVSDIY
jgi:hypothetical protein